MSKHQNDTAESDTQRTELPPTPSGAEERQLATACERTYCHNRTAYPVEISLANRSTTWCPECVRNEFDFQYHEYEQRQQSILRFITPETVAAFCLGVVLMLLIASIAVV